MHRPRQQYLVMIKEVKKRKGKKSLSFFVFIARTVARLPGYPFWSTSTPPAIEIPNILRPDWKPDPSIFWKKQRALYVFPASSWFLLRSPREKPLRATVSFFEWPPSGAKDE